MSESCRLCLRVQARAHLTSIFGQGESLKRLRSRILDACPITLFEDDRLPKAICKECRRKVAITYEFREQWRKSERELRSRYQSSYWNESNRFADKIVVRGDGAADRSKGKQRLLERKAEADAEVDANAKEDDGESRRERVAGEIKEKGIREEGKSGKRSVEWAESSIADGRPAEYSRDTRRGGDRDGDADKRYLCDVCSKMFLSKSGLRFHLKSHTGAKPHQCRHCGKRFTIPSYVARHERIHTGEKRFVCHVCSAEFASSNGLKYHLRSHTGEANYRCEVCGKTFNRPKYLKEHAYTHTGEKPFACRRCGCCYGNSGSLYVHEKRCKIRRRNNEDNGEARVYRNASTVVRYAN